MKIIPLLFLTFFTVSFTFAQQPVSFKIDGFSDKYYGIVTVKDTAEVFKAGTIKVFDKATKKVLLQVKSDELTFDFHDGKVQANILQAPYGEQSCIIYQDFNFDGVKDFALMDGQNSCYHGPSFQVYLSSPAGFKHSPGFTRLAQEFCGMFTVNTKDKLIETMTKSGCCWHQFTQYKVENNQPKPIREMVSSLNNEEPYLAEETEQTWINGKEETTMQQYLQNDTEMIDSLFSFTLAKNGKKVIIFHAKGDYIFYALLKKDESVEFYYPEVQYDEKTQEKKAGELNYGSGTLTFRNEDASYQIYDNGTGASRKVGIKVMTDGKMYLMEGLPETARGSLGALQGVNKKNLKKS